MIVVKQIELPVYCGVAEPLDLTIAAGEAVCVMGPSGRGKTTLLELLCGLEPWLAGSFSCLGVELSSLPAEQRGVGLVPQDTVLFPNLRVEKQIEFPLSARGWSLSNRRERVSELLVTLEIEHLCTKLPHELSGGEAKRVALARALAFRPKFLCLDEMTAGLDRVTEQTILAVIRQIMETESCSVLAATHSHSVAQGLGGQEIVLGEQGWS